MNILITTGTYKTSDYRIVKNCKSAKAALKFAKSIGFKGDEIYNTSWSNQGINYKISIN